MWISHMDYIIFPVNNSGLLISYQTLGIFRMYSQTNGLNMEFRSMESRMTSFCCLRNLDVGVDTLKLGWEE